MWEHKKGGEQTKKERPQKCIKSAPWGVGVSQQAGRAVGSRGALQSSIELTIIKDGPGKHSSVLRSILSDYWWEILIKNNNNNKPKKNNPPQPESSFKKEISGKNFGRLSSVKTDLVMQITAMNIKPLMKGF